MSRAVSKGLNENMIINLSDFPIFNILAHSGETSKDSTLRPGASSNDVNGEDDRQDRSSIGDITIDSVKDHLL